ncbi:MAG: hypothetical protein IJR99_15700 [Kiritimatiellae bacterium]|nr:hypothetical protein [Kiritimatiellia bacterium]
MIRTRLALSVLSLYVFACIAGDIIHLPVEFAGKEHTRPITQVPDSIDIPKNIRDSRNSRFAREKEKGYFYVRGFDGLLLGRYPLSLETEVPRGYISLPGRNEEDTVRRLKEAKVSITCESCPLDDFCTLLNSVLREIETPMIVECDIHPSWLGTEEVPSDRTFAGIFEKDWIRKEIQLPTVTLDMRGVSAYDAIEAMAWKLKDIVIIRIEDYGIWVELIPRGWKNERVKFIIE